MRAFLQRMHGVAKYHNDLTLGTYFGNTTGPIRKDCNNDDSEDEIDNKTVIIIVRRKGEPSEADGLGPQKVVW